jgi:cytochrome P450
MDTTSNSLSRILHILSENPEAQEKLRDEIRAAQADHGSEELDYDALNALPYLDAVCRETLRL